MKKTVLLIVTSLLLLTALATSCANKETDIKVVAPLDTGTKSINIEVTGGDFDTQPTITQSVDVVYPGSVVLTLNSNQTTGFNWTVETVNSNPEVLSQYEHNYVAPEATGIVGAAGKEVWTFKPLKQGTTTLTFEYSQPWEGGTKAFRSYRLTVNVK